MRLKTIVEVREKSLPNSMDAEGWYVQKEPPIPEGVRVELYGLVSLIPHGTPLQEVNMWFGGIMKEMDVRRNWLTRLLLGPKTTYVEKAPQGAVFLFVNGETYLKTLLLNLPIHPPFFPPILSDGLNSLVFPGRPFVLSAGDVVETRVRAGDGKFHKDFGVGLIVVQDNGEDVKGASR